MKRTAASYPKARALIEANALKVACPMCGAKKGKKCTGYDKLTVIEVDFVHPDRYSAAPRLDPYADA